MALQTKRSPLSDAPRPVLAHQRRGFLKVPIWARRSIRVRLQLSHLLTSLLPLLALGSALLYNSAQAEQRLVEQTQQSVVQVVATDIANFMQLAEYELDQFGRQVPMSSPRRSIQANAKQYMARQGSTLVELAILDLDGNERVHLSTTDAFGFGQLRNRSNEPFFALARQGWPQQQFTRSARGLSVLQIAVPARTNARPNGELFYEQSGVVVAEFSTHHIEQRLRTVPQSIGRSAFLIDNNGNPLLGQPPKGLENGPLQTWAASNMIRTTLTSMDGEQISVARAGLGVSTWSVVIEQPADIAYQSLRRNTTLLVLMLIITVILVIVWGVVLAREMTRPILHLRDGVRVLGSGQLGGTIAVERQDELGDLAEEFNRMSERLADSQRAIELRNARLSEGLALARIIQQDLLPPALPANSPINACAVCEPAAEIGGDFYTYVSLPDGRLRLIIGDASGKGVAAALVMALTSSLVEVHAPQATGPADLLMRLNQTLHPRFSSNHMSVSLLVAEFDPHTQQMCIANAGMIAPFVAEPQGCAYVPSYGPPLGVVGDAVYTETTIGLHSASTIVFVSDGIVEARNAEREMWGFHNMETTVCTLAGQSVDEIVANVLGSIKQHVGMTMPADDMTIIAATLQPHAEPSMNYQVLPLGEHSRASGQRSAAARTLKRG